jgi:hypothetical protein
MNGAASNYLKGSLYLGSTTAASAILTGRSAANLTLGLADAAAPVAQTLSVQNVVAGTTDTAGTNFTITGSRGTGTGAGGSILFQTAAASTTGSTQNALATALTIAGTGTTTLLTANASNLNVTSTTIPVNGIYLPAANSLGFATNTTLKATLDSSGNLFVGSTSLSTDLSTNQIPVAAGRFRSSAFTTASTASGTAVTIFAIPSDAAGVYLIQATLSAVNNVNSYSVVGLLVINGTTSKWTNLVTATNMTVAISGSNLQATQTSGASQAILATATRFA